MPLLPLTQIPSAGADRRAVVVSTVAEQAAAEHMAAALVAEHIAAVLAAVPAAAPLLARGAPTVSGQLTGLRSRHVRSLDLPAAPTQLAVAAAVAGCSGRQSLDEQLSAAAAAAAAVEPAAAPAATAVPQAAP